MINATMTNYDCAVHVANANTGLGIMAIERLAAHAAVAYDTHMSWEGYAKPTLDDRALIRTASERLNKNASREG